MKPLRPLAAAVLASLLVSLPVSLLGCGGTKPPPGPPPIVPYPGFFTAFIGSEIFVFADLKQKQKFDLDPSAVTYEEFLSRVGTRVFISDVDPELVPRMALGYEQAYDTELLPAESLDAPPARTGPPVAVRRRSLPAAPTEVEPAGEAGAAPPAAARPDTRLPPGELGPVGEPDLGLPVTRPVTRPGAGEDADPSVAVPAPLPGTRPAGG